MRNVIIYISLSWIVLFLLLGGLQLVNGQNRLPNADSGLYIESDLGEMMELWTVIVLLSPHAPSPAIFQKLCGDSGGDLRMRFSLITLPNKHVVPDIVLKCMVRKKPEPPKIGV